MTAVQPAGQHAGRHAARVDGSAAHPQAAACWLAVALVGTGAAMMAGVLGSRLWSWLLGTLAVGFAVLTAVALAPDRRRDEPDDVARRVGPGVYVQAHQTRRSGVHWFTWDPAAGRFVRDDDEDAGLPDPWDDNPWDDEPWADDILDDLRGHEDEDDPFGVIEGPPRRSGS